MVTTVGGSPQSGDVLKVKKQALKGLKRAYVMAVRERKMAMVKTLLLNSLLSMNWTGAKQV